MSEHSWWHEREYHRSDERAALARALAGDERGPAYVEQALRGTLPAPDAEQFCCDGCGRWTTEAVALSIRDEDLTLLFCGRCVATCDVCNRRQPYDQLVTQDTSAGPALVCPDKHGFAL